MADFDFSKYDQKKLNALDEKGLNELCAELRKEILTSVSRNGGHLSSNLGDVELIVALLSSFDPYKDDILFDVGHQAYAYKILTGRKLDDLRKKDGVAGFQKVGESEADRFESGHSGTSIATALGISAAKKLAGDDSYTVAVIGDASLANGESLEAINSLSEKNFGKLIIVINDNNMSISRPKGGMAHYLTKIRTSARYQEGASWFKRTFDRRGLRWIYTSLRAVKNFIKRIFIEPNIFTTLSNVSYLGPIDGHNITKMKKFFKRAKEVPETVIVHVKTVKGKGFIPSEKDKTGYWHGTSPFELDNLLPADFHQGYVSCSHLGGDAIYELMKKDPKALVITPAMIRGSHLEQCFADFPSRSFDCGIAEEEAVSLAAGMALKGYHPVLAIYSVFMQRSFDQLYNDIGRMHLDILVVIDRVGLIGGDGSSHQGIADPVFTLPIPCSVIHEPVRQESIRDLIVNASFNWNGPCFIRLERSYLPSGQKNVSLVNDVKGDYGILALGSEGLKLKELLKDVPFYEVEDIKPLDFKAISFALTKKRLYLYDPTSLEEGNAEYISGTLREKGMQGQITVLSLPSDRYYRHMSKDEQLEEVSLSPRQVAEFIKEKEAGTEENSKKNGEED